jgi:hypothetical protein
VSEDRRASHDQGPPNQDVETAPIGEARQSRSFAKQNPEGGLVGDEDVAWQRDPTAAVEEDSE